MKRTTLIVASALALVAGPTLGLACASFTGDNPVTEPDAAVEDAAIALVDASTNSADASMPNCIDKDRDAYLCDGFEGAAIDPRWMVTLMPPANGDPMAEQALAQLSAASPIDQKQSLLLGFQPIPSSGHAGLDYARPGGAGPLALRLKVRIADTSGTSIAPMQTAIAALGSGTTSALFLLYLPTANGTGAGTVELRSAVNGDTAYTSWPVTTDQASCFAFGSDGANVTYGQNTLATAPSAIGDVDTAGIGWTWGSGHYPDNERVFEYDDVIVSESAISCSD